MSPPPDFGRNRSKTLFLQKALNYCLPLLIFRSSYGLHLALHASAKPINEQYVSFRVFLGQLSQKTKVSNDPISLSAPCFLNYNYLSNRDHLRISQQLPHQNIYSRLLVLNMNPWDSIAILIEISRGIY